MMPSSEGCWERYVRYYLNYAQSYSEDWAWFDMEWPQIQRAWRRLASNEENASLVVAYALTFYSFQDRCGLWREASIWSQYGLEVIQVSGTREVEGLLLNNLGTAFTNLGEVQRAIDLYEQKLILARDIRDRDSEKNALLNLGVAYHRLGQITRATEYYEQVLTIARELDDREDEGKALANLGLVYADLGDAQRALEYYEQDLVIVREIRNQCSEVIALTNLGSALLNLGQVQRAISTYQQAIEISKDIGYQLGDFQDFNYPKSMIN